MQRHIELSPSRYFAFALVLAHGAAFLALLMVLPAWAAWASAILLLVSLLHYLLRDAWLRLPGSCVGLLIEEEESVALIMRDGRQVPCRILSGSLVTPVLTVLNLVLPDARMTRSVVILPDGLEAESFRQLRVWLKWACLPSRKSQSAPEMGTMREKEHGHTV
jgi:toxin CptA